MIRTALATEVGTPDGPFYSVVKVNAKSVVIYDADYDLTLRLPIRSTDAVLVQSSAA